MGVSKKTLVKPSDVIPQSIGVVGLWHLGSVLTAVWSQLGKKVVGFDTDPLRVQSLQQGKPPLYEPQLEHVIRSGLDRGSLSYTSDPDALKSLDVIILAEDTPVLENDQSDLGRMEELFGLILPRMKPQSLLVVSSQMPVGSCGKWRERLQKRDPSLEIVYSPENLRLGEAIGLYKRPLHIVLGGETIEAIQRAFVLFQHMQSKLLVMSLCEAEMVKHGINAFLSMEVTYANQIADLCFAVGADYQKVATALRADPRIGDKAYLTTGLGFSGGTLGRDLRVLEEMNARYDGIAPMFGQILAYNHSRPSIVVNNLAKLLKGLKGRTIGALGVTYKPGTSVIRRSLQLEVVRQLAKQEAHVNVYDPRADLTGVKLSPLVKLVPGWRDAAEGADAVVLLTEWPEFADLDFKIMAKHMKGRLLFDTKNLWINRHADEFKPLTYLKIG